MLLDQLEVLRLSWPDSRCLPILEPDFYLNNSGQSIGGPTNRDTRTGTVYSIPNMIYDFPQGGLGSLLTDPGGGTDLFLRLIPAGNLLTAPLAPTSPVPQKEPIGLYDWNQFELFYNRTLGAVLGTGSTPGPISSTQLLEAVKNALKPTLYEAVNWMVPLKTIPSEQMAAPSTAVTPNDATDEYYWLYAPLHGAGTLYSGSSAIENVVKEPISGIIKEP